MSKIKYRVHKQYYRNIASKIITGVTIDSKSTKTPQRIKVDALWDTGATISAISKRKAEYLNLAQTGVEPIRGIDGIKEYPTVYISILFENDYPVLVKSAICDLAPDFDLVIGMNVISKGDFCISNMGNDTLFSFVMPPLDRRTDLSERAYTLNQRNKV
jgi:hypothetical protein